MTAEPSHRRGQAIADVVLDATLGLLANRGYAFTVEEVAAAAGVHKTTVYRRWETKAALVAAAVGRLAAQDIPVERTNDPITDLTALAVLVARSLRHPAAVQALRAVVAAAGEDSDLLPTARRFLTDRYQLAVAIVDDAIALGALRTDIDATLVWEAIVNPLHLRAITGTPTSDDVARALVALVVNGARRTCPPGMRCSGVSGAGFRGVEQRARPGHGDTVAEVFDPGAVDRGYREDGVADGVRECHDPGEVWPGSS